jgi:chemotaxis protein CheD
MAADALQRDTPPTALRGFEGIRRYRNASGQLVARLLPGEYYVTPHDEVLDTVLGSCVSACIRAPRLRIGGMNHFMLPSANGGAEDAWDQDPGRAMRYGSASMEQLINRLLEVGGTRSELEVKIFGGGRVLASLTDIGAHNVKFVRDFLRKEGMGVVAEDVGADVARHVQYFPLTGRVRMRHLTRHQDIARNEQRYLHGLERAPLAGEIDLF